MHVQFATQNYLQLYGNPGNSLWKQAPKLKSFLVRCFCTIPPSADISFLIVFRAQTQTELDDITSGTSINIENLDAALNVVNKWENDLMQPDTEENKEYAE